MKNRVKLFRIISFLIMIGFLLAGCPNPADDGKDDGKAPMLTGTVSIVGIAQVGQTLTANTNALGGNGTISYQWKRGGIDIGTNSSFYTVQAADTGSAITVTVSRDGYSGSVTSTPTATVVDDSGLPALSGTVSIIGTAQVGQTLTADTSNLGGSGTISYQWQREGINIGTNSNTYIVQELDLGYVIWVTVSRDGHSGSVTSLGIIVTDPSVLLPLTGTVIITGIPQAGEMIHAGGPFSWVGTIHCQWMRDGVAIGTDATGYFVQAEDIGHTITLTVSSSGNSGSLTSEPTAVIEDYRPLIGTVSISGTAEVGCQLIAFSDLDYYFASGTIHYQWKRDGIKIGTATELYYTLQAADAGSTITVTITREGHSGSVTSEPTAVVEFPVLSGTVAINGVGYVGEMLTPTYDIYALGGNTFSYQWKRDGIEVGTNYDYLVQATDAGCTITLTMTCTNYVGEVTSDPIGPIIIPVALIDVSANGSSAQTTTQLTLTFNQEITGLAANDITLSGIAGVSKGTLSGSGTTYTLSISGFTVGGSLGVSITSSGYIIHGGTTMGYVNIYCSASVEMIIELAEMNEWDLIEQTAQATANVNKTFTVTGTYATYEWYLDGISVGTSSSYTFNKPADVYQLMVVVTDSNGESRSGRVRITVAN